MASQSVIFCDLLMTLLTVRNPILNALTISAICMQLFGIQLLWFDTVGCVARRASGL